MTIEPCPSPQFIGWSAPLCRVRGECDARKYLHGSCNHRFFMRSDGPAHLGIGGIYPYFPARYFHLARPIVSYILQGRICVGQEQWNRPRNSCSNAGRRTPDCAVSSPGHGGHGIPRSPGTGGYGDCPDRHGIT